MLLNAWCSQIDISSTSRRTDVQRYITYKCITKKKKIVRSSWYAPCITTYRYIGRRRIVVFCGPSRQKRKTIIINAGRLKTASSNFPLSFTTVSSALSSRVSAHVPIIRHIITLHITYITAAAISSRRTDAECLLRPAVVRRHFI